MKTLTLLLCAIFLMGVLLLRCKNPNSGINTHDASINDTTDTSRVTFKEMKCLNGQVCLYIVTIDSVEYLCSSEGGIIKL